MGVYEQTLPSGSLRRGVPIVSGETYYGPSCTVYTTGDVDSFQFNAAAGDHMEYSRGREP
jgi:hypothetical protein